MKKTPALFFVGLLLTLVAGYAQPSGGPYGPQHQSYDVPKTGGNIYYVAPNGSADAAGTTLEQPTTIEAAISRVATGDAIVARGGTYRTGDLKVNQGVTIQPYLEEQPIFKGTEVATKWEALRGNIWRTKWTKLFPAKPADWWRRERNGRTTPVYLFNNDMVFVDGKPLRTVGYEGQLDANSYTIDYDRGYVYLGVDPTNKLVEITAHDSAIVRVITDVHGKKSDAKGLVLRGLTFTQYAYRALEIEANEPEKLADPATFGKDVVGSVLENLTITHCSRVAGYFRGDKLIIRNCLVSDTSTEGIYVLSSADVLLERNIIRRNNVENIYGYYPSAVKIFNQCYRTVCRENLVLENPNSSGIWYDVGNVDGVFVNNWIVNATEGFFFEISKGATCVGNVFVNCDRGSYVLNSSNVAIYQNTYVNSPAQFERTERSAVGDHFGWHPSTGPDVEQRFGHSFANNLIVVDPEFQGPLVLFKQSAVLCGRLKEAQAKEIDHNVYVRRGIETTAPLMTWSPAEGTDCTATIANPAALQKLHSEFSAHDKYLNGYAGAVFVGQEVGRFELLPSFPVRSTGGTIPAKVRELLGWPAGESGFPGAYPVSARAR